MPAAPPSSSCTLGACMALSVCRAALGLSSRRSVIRDGDIARCSVVPGGAAAGRSPARVPIPWLRGNLFFMQKNLP